MAIALGGLAMGCGDDSPTPVADSTSGSTTSDDTTTGVDGTTMVADDTTTDTSAGSGNADSGDSDSSSGEPPPVEVTVEGTVRDFALDTIIADSSIGIYENPELTATSDSRGFFSIGSFMPDTTALFVLAPSDEYWGAVIPITIESDPLQEDVELSQISTAIVDTQIMQLEDQMPADPDLSQSIIIVRLINNTAVMEGPTTITMDPPPEDGTYYAPDAGGIPNLNQSDIEFALIPVVVYFNVEESAPGDITFTAEHPMRDCEVLYPELPTIGEHMTLFDVECLPP